VTFSLLLTYLNVCLGGGAVSVRRQSSVCEEAELCL